MITRIFQYAAGMLFYAFGVVGGAVVFYTLFYGGLQDITNNKTGNMLAYTTGGLKLLTGIPATLIVYGVFSALGNLAVGDRERSN
jgi:hypothetical protein